jgi:hypothetical protein
MNVGALLRRVAKMEPGELVHRAGELGIQYGAVLRYWRKSGFESFAEHRRLQRVEMPVASALNGPFDLYGRQHDPYQDFSWLEGANGQWPLRPSALLSYRPDNPHGDVRPVWELSRLQFLPGLANADPARAQGVLAHWMRSNPYRWGPNWMSAMEVALRWVSVYRAACLMKLPADMEREVVGLGVASGRFISHHLSLGSSAGNHLVAEALGLVWCGVAVGHEAWIEEGERLLNEQLPRQIQSDGTGVEQTIWYLGLIVDAALHWDLLRPLPEPVRDRVTASLAFLAEVVTPNGVYPDIGDRDDGQVSPLRDVAAFVGLIADGANQFDSIVLPSRSVEGPTRVTYRDGGLTSLRRGQGRLLFHHGPLGMPYLFGHGHAGALAITLTWGETPLLIDPGTGQYSVAPAWRDHFRSTAAHNTVTLNGANQATMASGFSWADPWDAQLVSEVDDRVRARCAYANGLTHRRDVHWPSNKRVVVVDSFGGQNLRRAVGYWHFGDADVTVDDGVVTARFSAVQLRIDTPDGASVTLHRGDKDPRCGWRSTHYGHWEPAPVVRVVGDTSLDWTTVFTIS